MYVCMYVYDNFPKPQLKKFIFTHSVYLDGIRVKFVCEGHRVKVKVTGARGLKSLFPQCFDTIVWVI